MSYSSSVQHPFLCLDLKLLLDMVPNHSSSKCQWFLKSIRREGKYEDYYVWRNASNQDMLGNSSVEPTPPNNWVNDTHNK